MKYKIRHIFACLLTVTMLVSTTCNTQAEAAQSNTTAQAAVQNDAVSQTEAQDDTEIEYYTFELNDNVTRTHVSYKNRFGITLAADLYIANNLDAVEKHPALVIGAPYGGVKEQGPGGFAITAAQVDKRIKAVATTSMYDISRNIRYGFGDTMTDEQLDELLEQLAQQRWEDFENGEPEYIPFFPAKADNVMPEGLDPISVEFYGYYGLERGHHPNARGGFTTTSMLSFINFPLVNYIETISPRLILFIIGENAHSRYSSEDAYEMAAEPKELYVVPDADHVALYDQLDKIPFDKMESFFKEAFK